MAGLPSCWATAAAACGRMALSQAKKALNWLHGPFIRIRGCLGLVRRHDECESRDGWLSHRGSPQARPARPPRAFVSSANARPWLRVHQAQALGGGHSSTYNTSGASCEVGGYFKPHQTPKDVTKLAPRFDVHAADHPAACSPKKKKKKKTTALWPIGCIPGPLLTSDACDRFGRPHAAGWPMRRWATTTSEGTPARPRSEGIHFSQVPVLQYYWRGCIPRVSVPPRVTHCGTTGRRDTFGSFPGIE